MRKSIAALIGIGAVLLIFVFYFSKNNDDTEKLTEERSAKSAEVKPDTANKFDPFKTTTDEPPNSVKYIVNTDSSIVNWSISRHKGYVKFEEGYLSVLNNELTGGIFYVAMDSIKDVDIDYKLMKTVLEKVLKSPEFFNTRKYPTSAFKIENLRKIGPDKYLVSGYMKIFDKIRNIKFKVEVNIKKDTLRATTDKFFIDRTKWGLTAYSKNYVQQDTSFVVPDSIGFVIKILAVKSEK